MERIDFDSMLQELSMAEEQLNASVDSYSESLDSSDTGLGNSPIQISQEALGNSPIQISQEALGNSPIQISQEALGISPIQISQEKVYQNSPLAYETHFTDTTTDSDTEPLGITHVTSPFTLSSEPIQITIFVTSQQNQTAIDINPQSSVLAVINVVKQSMNLIGSTWTLMEITTNGMERYLREWEIISTINTKDGYLLLKEYEFQNTLTYKVLPT
jgi:hypothetical protein